jgi:ADP-dependent NAD(P)H-hydrate dehydratase / NAD(P)H-hydrate epimerase
MMTRPTMTPLPPSPDGFEPVLSTEAMRTADRRTMAEFGLPGFTLMETAGRGAADAIEQVFGPMAGRDVLVLAGRGNNGGDGFVVARVLAGRGARVRVVALGLEDDVTEDAARHLRLFRALAEHDDALRLDAFDDIRQVAAANPPALVVDALLGIGVTGPLREPVDALARWINGQPAPVVALDVPTGLDADTGRAADDAVRADLTVTMAARKTGLLFNAGPAHAGRVEVVDIGVLPHVLADVLSMPGCARRSTDEAVRRLLPIRASDAHKYSAGKVVAVAGSRAFPGAAAMAAEAAARAGAGAVVCCTPESARPLVAAHLVEVMSEPMPETGGGTLARAALDALAERAAGADAVLVGCGLGRDPETYALVRDLLPRLGAPLVLDADGLNALAGHTDLLSAHAAGRWVLTPHLGELNRLAGDDLDPTDRVRLAARWAARWDCVLVVKGMPSVVGTPDGRVFIGGAGNVALATAGTGDVLAGMTAGLLAQGLGPAEAAVCALHLGGLAADRYAAARDPRSMLATDLLRELPHVLGPIP